MTELRFRLIVNPLLTLTPDSRDFFFLTQDVLSTPVEGALQLGEGSVDEARCRGGGARTGTRGSGVLRSVLCPPRGRPPRENPECIPTARSLLSRFVGGGFILELLNLHSYWMI